MKILKSVLSVLFVLVLSFSVVRPLFHSGFFPMHDDTQVARVFEMGKSLHDGMFPVRWVSDLGYGYGYPIFTFYAPLAYYVGGFLITFGTDPLVATKLMMGIGMLLAGVSMYLFGKSVWGRAGGVVGAIFYMYATYHAVDIYVRGDVAEFFAYAFIPLAAYGVFRTFKKKDMLSVVIGSLGFTGIIISHNLTAFMVAPFLFAFALILSFVLWNKEHSLIRSLVPFYPLLGGGLFAAFYWLPVFAEMRYTNVVSQVGGAADFRKHFVCLQQLWYSPWGYGGSVPGCTDGLSFMVGKLHLLAALLAIPAVMYTWKKNNRAWYFLTGGLVGFILAVLFTTEYSSFIWNAFSFMAFFQYPWRFLLLVSFFSSFLAAGLISLVPKKSFRFIASAVVLGSVILLQSKFFVPQTVISVTSAQLTNTHMLRWTTSKISDEYMPKGFAKPHAQNELPLTSFTARNAKNGLILILQDKTQEKDVLVDSQSPAEVLANIAYFPAWKMYINGRETAYMIGKTGLSFSIPQGRHIVSARYVSTPVEIAGNAVTVTSVCLALLGIIYERSKRKHAKSRI